MSTLGVVLAGGSSIRFGGDKAAALLGGRTLLQHVCDCAAPQVAKLLVNRNNGPLVVGEYEYLPDDRPGEGPLAGILAALDYALSHGFTHIANFPCDAPFLPADLVNRLREQLIATRADYCIVRCGAQEHHAFALWDVTCAAVLKDAFQSGMRSLRDASNILTKTAADFPVEQEGSIGDPFLNINTPDDLILAARWLASPQAS
jgi:molybdenum cofactor guanylyltransferase